MLIVGIIAIVIGIILNSMGFGFGEISFIVGVLLIIVWFFKGHGSKIFNKLLSGQDLNSTLRESAVEKIATHVDEDKNPLISKMLKAQKKFFWECQKCGEEIITMGATQVTASPSNQNRCIRGGTHRWFCTGQEELNTDLQFNTSANSTSSAYKELSDAKLWQAYQGGSPELMKKLLPELIQRGYIIRNSQGKLERTGKAIPK